MECGIISAGVEHADIVGLITARSWQAAYKGIVPDEYLAKVTPEFRAERFKTVLAQLPDVEFYIALAEGNSAGVFNLHACMDEDAKGCGEIGVFYFLPEYWGTGCAVPAMEFALGRLKERGFEEVILNVLEENARARRFYEKQGFAPDGCRFTVDLGRELMHMRFRKTLDNGI